MEMEAVNLITNVGFPITMVLIFVFRIEKIIKENTDAIQQLKEAIIIHNNG